MGSTSRRIAGIIVIAIFSLLIVACGAAGGPALGPAPVEERGGEPGFAGGDDGAGEPGSDGGGTDHGGGGAPFDPASPVALHIIKTGEIAIRVGDVVEGVTAVRSLAREMGGYVGSSQSNDTSFGATLTLRVPAERFDDTLERVRALGTEVLNEATREEDVTSAIVDLDARITNLQASEETYRALLERTERIDDILAVQARLDEVRGQIEQLEAEAAYLEEQSELSTLTVSLVPAPLETSTEGWNPGEAVNLAIAALVTVGQTLLVVLIWVAIVILPLLLVIGVITFIVIRVVEAVRRRAASRPPVA